MFHLTQKKEAPCPRDVKSKTKSIKNTEFVVAETMQTNDGCNVSVETLCYKYQDFLLMIFRLVFTWHRCTCAPVIEHLIYIDIVLWLLPESLGSDTASHTCPWFWCIETLVSSGRQPLWTEKNSAVSRIFPRSAELVRSEDLRVNVRRKDYIFVSITTAQDAL